MPTMRLADFGTRRERRNSPRTRNCVRASFDRETKRVFELVGARVAVLAPKLGKYRLRATGRGAEVTTPEGEQMAALSLTAKEHSILHVCISDELGVELCNDDVQLLPLRGKDLWAVGLEGALDSREFVEHYVDKLLDEATKGLG